MDLKFKIGDEVMVLDEDVHGVVTDVHQNQVSILTHDGFEQSYLITELLKRSKFDISMVNSSSKEDLINTSNISSSSPTNKKLPLVVDLHLHHLVKKESGLTAHDKLQIQLNTVKDKLQWARDNKVQKMIFIHGLGKGVLRKELEILLNSVKGITYYDASFKDYGRGAIEVKLYQNIKN